MRPTMIDSIRTVDGEKRVSCKTLRLAACFIHGSNFCGVRWRL